MGQFCHGPKPHKKGQRVEKIGRTWLYRLRDNVKLQTLRRLDDRALLNAGRAAQRPQTLLRKKK